MIKFIKNIIEENRVVNQLVKMKSDDSSSTTSAVGEFLIFTIAARNSNSDEKMFHNSQYDKIINQVLQIKGLLLTTLVPVPIAGIIKPLGKDYSQILPIIKGLNSLEEIRIIAGIWEAELGFIGNNRFSQYGYSGAFVNKLIKAYTNLPNDCSWVNESCMLTLGYKNQEYKVGNDNYFKV